MGLPWSWKSHGVSRISIFSPNFWKRHGILTKLGSVMEKSWNLNLEHKVMEFDKEVPHYHHVDTGTCGLFKTQAACIPIKRSWILAIRSSNNLGNVVEF